ncbi:hypothetical protein PR202_ga01934 [Eleusine coracana subsp. coracana]|uniref:C2 domain-containing protein n=1 Tax=Eleusine coracana subsp. coracana TaxID=191504 RepID=A0AAV5BJ63_ELECO|nr:hypothetical protein PR202_ga01247 [Eleusine coracana subsp. coracana]GJM86110.1 hypothetical protein PR202_ga01934 [Eleusine coracana subsp. coracana]
MGECLSWAVGRILPSLWEAEVAFSAAALLAAALFLFLLSDHPSKATTGSGRSSGSSASAPSSAAATFIRGRSWARWNNAAADEIVPCPPITGGHVIKLELLSAKYLIGANLNGASDPYAVISCGDQKRFSSMVPSLKNPLWGEEFNFLVQQLPVEIKRSQHSLINPAISIILHADADGHEIPHSCSQNGRARYTFASFWNRNRTFRALETAIQNYRATFKAEKQIYETKQQAHDVPFGSYFEIHSRWSLRTTSRSACQVDIKIGVNMKKWCILQSKIKSGATDEYRREVSKILEAACSFLLKSQSNSQDSDDIVEASLP